MSCFDVVAFQSLHYDLDSSFFWLDLVLQLFNNVKNTSNCLWHLIAWLQLLQPAPHVVCRICNSKSTTVASTHIESIISAVLQRWRDLVIESDPDIIIGYNIVNFDLPYLIQRAEALKIVEFPYWGRIRKKCVFSMHPVLALPLYTSVPHTHTSAQAKAKQQTGTLALPHAMYMHISVHVLVRSSAYKCVIKSMTVHLQSSSSMLCITTTSTCFD